MKEKKLKRVVEKSKPSLLEMFFFSLVALGFGLLIVTLFVNGYFLASLIALIAALIIINLLVAIP